MWFHENVWNGGKSKPVGFDVEKDPKANQTVAMAVYPNGELHVFADGKDLGAPWQNLPSPDVPLYGVVGLENYGPSSRGSFKLGEYIYTFELALTIVVN